MDSFALKSIEVKKDQLWIQSNCMPLYLCVETGAKGHKTKKISDKLQKIFCVESSALAEQWMKAIDEFHRCELESTAGAEDSTNKLKSKIKRKGMESDEQMEERRKKQILETEQASANEVESEREEEKKQMDKMMKELMEQYRQHKELERKRREKLREERAKMRERNKRLGSQARCIETALEVKAMQDEITLESLLKETKSLHERNLLKDAENKMQKLWSDGDADITQQEADLRKAQADVYEKMKKELIQEAADWTKDLDPIDCYRDSLSGGNLVEMKRVCANTVDYGAVPDLKKLLTCLDKKGFCGICCGYYIGAAKETDKVRCMKQCDDIINGDANAYLIKYGIGRKKLSPDPKATNGVDITGTGEAS